MAVVDVGRAVDLRQRLDRAAVGLVPAVDADASRPRRDQRGVDDVLLRAADQLAERATLALRFDPLMVQVEHRHVLDRVAARAHRHWRQLEAGRGPDRVDHAPRRQRGVGGIGNLPGEVRGHRHSEPVLIRSDPQVVRRAPESRDPGPSLDHRRSRHRDQALQEGRHVAGRELVAEPLLPRGGGQSLELGQQRRARGRGRGARRQQQDRRVLGGRGRAAGERGGQGGEQGRWAHAERIAAR